MNARKKDFLTEIMEKYSYGLGNKIFVPFPPYKNNL
jgi:hypothetical protein